MSGFSDQRGRPLGNDEFFTNMAEAILANYLAMIESGVPRERIRMVVGADGGTVTDGEALFQTPVAARLEEADSKRLLKTVGVLLEELDAGRLPEGQLARIRERHRVAHKIRVLTESREKS